MSVFPACMLVYCVYMLVPDEAGRKGQVPWNWSYWQLKMWMLGTKPMFSARAVNLSLPELSFQPPHFFFLLGSSDWPRTLQLAQASFKLEDISASHSYVFFFFFFLDYDWLIHTIKYPNLLAVSFSFKNIWILTCPSQAIKMKEDNEYKGPKSKYIIHKYVSFLLRNTSFFSVLEMLSSARATPGLGSCPFTSASEAAGATSDHPHLTKHLSLGALNYSLLF